MNREAETHILCGGVRSGRDGESFDFPIPPFLLHKKNYHMQDLERTTMTETIEVTVRVYLQSAVDGESATAREIVQAVLNGEQHPMIDEVELVQFKTEDETIQGTLAQ